jgi:hypothetical protein
MAWFRPIRIINKTVAVIPSLGMTKLDQPIAQPPSLAAVDPKRRTDLGSLAWAAAYKVQGIALMFGQHRFIIHLSQPGQLAGLSHVPPCLTEG